MDGRYPPPMPPMDAFYSTGPLHMYPSEPFPQSLQQFQSISMESIGTYSDYDDPNRAMLPPGQAQQRQRRRQPQGPEHVKHRRTRSGCFTCRHRRVKCDESHPICDRCRKGKRECHWPGESFNTVYKPARSHIRSKGGDGDSGSSPSDAEELGEDREALSTIKDEEEYDSEPGSITSDARKQSDASTASQVKVDSPASQPSTPSHGPSRPQLLRASSSKHGAKPSISQSDRWHTVPNDVKGYIRYHKDNLSHHHYGIKYDGNDFLKTTFLEIAMNDDSHALLYAIVAFSAYHHAVFQQEDRIQTFLDFYNQSIQQLQQSLLKRRHSVATLLTILQLATIEEFLGDWVNLLAHQRAAHQILTELFTPQTIIQDETRRKIITWYIRFDLFAGMLSGGQTSLGREWFATPADFYMRQVRDRPQDLGAQFEEYFATTRLLATDVALLFADKNQRPDDFAGKAKDLMRQFARFGQRVQTAFPDPSCFVKDFRNAPQPNDDEITDFRDPNFCYAGDLFTMNYVLIDVWAIELMFKYQLMLAQQQLQPQLQQQGHQGQLSQPQNPIPPAELTQIALKKCKMFEAIQYSDHDPLGAILGCQASLGIASLFLPKDDKHTMWCRRKFALIEQNGYIYPTTLRHRMSALWETDVTRWWLPNDEGLPAVIRAIRDFIEYRAQMPRDAVQADVREMSGIFGRMGVEGSP